MNGSLLDYRFAVMTKNYMKTLLITIYNLNNHGGVENYYRNLIKHWPKPEEIKVLQNDKGKLTTRWLMPRWLPALELLYRTIIKEKIKHILVGEILPAGTVAYYITKFTKTPYTVFIHGMDFTLALRKTRKKRIAKRILTNAANVICANSYVAELVKEFLGQEQRNKVTVVNPGVNTRIQEYKNIEKQASELKEKYKLRYKIVLFSIGRLVKRKGFDMAIKSLPEVYKYIPNLQYVLAGDGPDKKYIYDMAKGVPNIIFLGKITEEEKWAWLNLCDILIMPSREVDCDFEGFGIVYLEANLCGKPVIAGDSGGVRDAVKGAITGILIDPNDSEDIANAIITLAKDKDLRDKLGEQGRERALKDFRWEGQAEKIYNLVTHNS